MLIRHVVTRLRFAMDRYGFGCTYAHIGRLLQRHFGKERRLLGSISSSPTIITDYWVSKRSIFATIRKLPKKPSHFRSFDRHFTRKSSISLAASSLSFGVYCMVYTFVNQLKRTNFCFKWNTWAQDSRKTCIYPIKPAQSETKQLNFWSKQYL